MEYVKLNKRGVDVGAFRIRLETQRSALAPLFHEAIGFLREIESVQKQIAEDGYSFGAAPGIAPSELVAFRATAQGLLASHLGMLRLRCATSATSLIVFIDNAAREIAQNSDKRVDDISGGPVVNGVTIFEALRAVGNWSRHHYEWKGEKTNWNRDVLKALGLRPDDSVLPARVLSRYGFQTYASFEYAILDAFRRLVHSWYDDENEGWILATADDLQRIAAGAEDVVMEGLLETTEAESLKILAARASTASANQNWAVAEALFQKASTLQGVTDHQMAELQFNRGVCFDNMGRYERAAQSYEKAAEYATRHVELEAYAAHALFQMAVDAYRLQRPLESIDTSRKLIDRHGGSTDNAVLIWVTRSYVNIGIALVACGKPSEGLLEYSTVIDSFRHSGNADIRYNVARAIMLKADVLWDRNTVEAKALYSDFVSYAESELAPGARDVLSETLARAQQRIDAIDK